MSRPAAAAAKGAPLPDPNIPVTVGLQYDKQTFDFVVEPIKGMATMAIHIYLLTGVFPSRQKIMCHGRVLYPDDSLAKAGLQQRDKLMLLNMPPGQELEPVHHISPHPVDRTRSKIVVIQELVNAAETAIGMCGRPDQMAKLHKLVSVSEDLGTKLLLQVDEIQGDDTVRQARKGLVKFLNGELERLDQLKAKTAPSGSAGNPVNL